MILFNNLPQNHPSESWNERGYETSVVVIWRVVSATLFQVPHPLCSQVRRFQKLTMEPPSRVLERKGLRAKRRLEIGSVVIEFRKNEGAPSESALPLLRIANWLG
jgi:hypothetical protein